MYDNNSVQYNSTILHVLYLLDIIVRNGVFSNVVFYSVYQRHFLNSFIIFCVIFESTASQFGGISDNNIQR